MQERSRTALATPHPYALLPVGADSTNPAQGQEPGRVSMVGGHTPTGRIRGQS
jgi:hypothetical protein